MARPHSAGAADGRAARDLVLSDRGNATKEMLHVPLADVPKYKAMIGHAIVTVSDLLELVGRGLDRGAVTTNRRTLNHRAPHRKSKGVVAAW